MTPDEMMTLLTSLEKRLAPIAEQAQQVLDRVNRLRADLAQLKQALVEAMKAEE